MKKISLKMMCEECGCIPKIINEVGCMYCCNDCAENLIRASKLDAMDEEAGIIKDERGTRPKFDF